MINLAQYRQEWFGNIRADLLSGLVVALALIPESIAFTLIIGVDPVVGLYASFAIAIITAIAGGRPGMISAATAATAVMLTSLVRDHGLQYLLAAGVLAGVLQIMMGLLRLGALMRYVSSSVMMGFVNALAMLILIAQLPELDPRLVGPETYLVVAAGLAIIILAPRFIRSIPAPLLAIAILTAISMIFGLDLRSVGDKGTLPDSLPSFLIPDVPFDLDMLRIILPYSLGVAVVGLLESLMTQNLLDQVTETRTNRNQECIGQGLANIGSGFLGGMPGCAMIGQSIINIRNGGRGRLSCAFAGVMLMVLCVGLGPWVSKIPMGALTAVMLMIAATTFSWDSIRNLRNSPASSNIVMLATVAGVIATTNLAIGALIGVILSGLFFVAKVARQFEVRSTLSPDGNTRTYQLLGSMFYASSDGFAQIFDYEDKARNIVIDLSSARIWDVSSVNALAAVIAKLRRTGAQVTIEGLDHGSRQMLARFGHDLSADSAAS